MMRGGILVVLGVLLLAPAAQAQNAPWRFRWQQGQVLIYRVEQTTKVMAQSSGEDGALFGTTSKLNLTKRWRVLEVDAEGVATLQLSLDALRLETNVAGNPLVFDSANPDKSDPQMREQMQRYVGAPLALLRIDAAGRVVQVKESKHGPASRYTNELPFAVVLPAAVPEPGQSWQRVYPITLDPPNGVGETHAAEQKFTCTRVADGQAVLTVSTKLKAPPQAFQDHVPLLQFLPEGEVVFDTKAGILRSANLRIEKELKGEQGKGFHNHQSTYKEEYVGSK